ncbi:MAG: class B sortase [Oscillospiraceae bacterium]|nr:class B sortase [Oscillospiraceae bacterium]
MKKALIALVAVLAAALIGLGAWGLYLLTEPAPPAASSSAQTGLGTKNGDGDRQPAINQTPLTGADVLQAIGNAKKVNADTIGWLKVPGTNIDNCVLQSHDNEYYLRKTERKEYDVYGCYFADYECDFGGRDALSPNTVIYGHSDLKNDPNGYRFSQLFHFTDETFARNTPYIYFSTDKEYMIWQVFAVFYTDTGMDYIVIDQTAEQLEALIAEAREKSLYQYEVQASGTDKILCLSTCSVKYGGRPDERFVVMARLLPPDAELSGTAVFTVNPSPRQPDFS